MQSWRGSWLLVVSLLVFLPALLSACSGGRTVTVRVTGIPESEVIQVKLVERYQATRCIWPISCGWQSRGAVLLGAPKHGRAAHSFGESHTDLN